ncbi:hypothetical protein PUMCH_000251 [Australozyma saopauloensis]|uniref:Zn(2)-C6 fungal-type domain-containing protein n=1 Tax=Australozyma saopauloensis TaxID=291208 RepID=A0AAX4H3B0_9ASCO|nr:hypothetical protein PUMCH_000251 [[Candida] saopauloensis]
MLTTQEEGDHEQKLRKRNRVSLLCDQCRRRKVKCDRNLPCLTCVKHKCSVSCSYSLDSIAAVDLGMAGNLSIFRTFKPTTSVASLAQAPPEPSPQDQSSNDNHIPKQTITGGHLVSTDHTPMPKIEVFSEISALKAKLQQLESYIAPLASQPMPGQPLPTTQPATPQQIGQNDMLNSHPEGQNLLPQQPHVYFQPVQHPDQQAIMYQQHQPLRPQFHQHPLPQQLHPPIHLQQHPSLIQVPNFAVPQPHYQQPYPRDASSLPSIRDLPQHHLPTPLSESNILQNTLSPRLLSNSSSLTNLYQDSLLRPRPQLTPSTRLPSRPDIPKNEIGYQNVQRSEDSQNRLPSNESHDTFLGVNIYNVNEPDELLDIYSGYNSIFEGHQDHEMNYGPFVWLSFIRKDRFCNLIWNFIAANGKKTGEPQMIPKKHPSGDTAHHEQQFQQNSLKREEISPFNLTEIKVQLNKEALSLGLTVYEGVVDPKLNLRERIRLSLPSQRSIWILINRFFRRVYPFMPLLDETYFRKQISRILGPEKYTDAKYEEIKTQSKNDFATLGILLIVLRLAYLSSFSNRSTVNERILASAPDPDLAEMRYILSNPINIDVISVARLCLQEFDLYKKNALVVLQCVVFLRIYGALAPEDGDGTDGNDGHVLNSVCIQISYCMGLNREPTNYTDDLEKERANNIKRKIWLHLRMLDLHLSFEFGFPPVIHDGYNDIQRPFLGQQNSNTFDINMERALCDFIVTVDDVVSHFRSVVSKCLQINNKLKMSEATEFASQLERKMRCCFGSLSDYTRPIENRDEFAFIRVWKCKFYLCIRIFTSSLYYHFFLNYEKAGLTDLCFFYARKIMSIFSCEILPELLFLILHNDKNFDNTSTVSDMILNPVIEFAVHKGNQFNFGLWVRINEAINLLKSDRGMHNENMAHNPTYNLKFGRLCTMAKLLDKLCRFSTKCISRLGQRYYYAWRVSKAHLYLCNVVSSESFQNYAREADHKFVDFNSNQLGELIEMAEKAIQKMKLAVQQDHRYSKSESELFEKSKAAQSEVKEEFPIASAHPAHSSVPEDYETAWSASTGVSNLSLDFDDLGFVSNGAIDDLWKNLSNFTGIVDQHIQVGQPDDFY